MLPNRLWRSFLARDVHESPKRKDKQNHCDRIDQDQCDRSQHYFAACVKEERREFKRHDQSKTRAEATNARNYIALELRSRPPQTRRKESADDGNHDEY